MNYGFINHVMLKCRSHGPSYPIAKLLFQMHWNNPLFRTDYTDSSGMTFYLTPNTRPYDAGVLMTGQNFLEIPPGQNAYSTDGSCLGSCNQHLMEGPVYIMEAFNHMHYLGEQYCPAHFYTQAREYIVLL